jgi:hypothetical protein
VFYFRPLSSAVAVASCVLMKASLSIKRVSVWLLLALLFFYYPVPFVHLFFAISALSFFFSSAWLSVRDVCSSNTTGRQTNKQTNNNNNNNKTPNN